MDNLLPLNKPIKELPLSEEFKYMAEINGFENMKEIISINATSLFQREGVNYHIYKELADYLKVNNLLHLFKQQ
jgi:hypothetical protein